MSQDVLSRGKVGYVTLCLENSGNILLKLRVWRNAFRKTGFACIAQAGGKITDWIGHCWMLFWVGEPYPDPVVGQTLADYKSLPR